MPIRLAYFRTEPISTYIHTTQCWAGLFRGPVCLCPTHNQASQSHRRTPLPSAPAAHPLCANIFTIFHYSLPLASPPWPSPLIPRVPSGA